MDDDSAPGGGKRNVRDTAREPEYDGTETTAWGDVSKTLSNYVEGYFRHSDKSRDDFEQNEFGEVENLPGEIKSWIANKTLLGEAGADTVEDLIFFPVVNPNTNALNEGALNAVRGGRGAQADVPADAFDSAEEMAARLLKREFDADIDTNEADPGEGWIEQLRRKANELLGTLNGANLGAVMDEKISRARRDDETRGEVYAKLSQATKQDGEGISPSTVSSIVNPTGEGGVNCPPVSRLKSFARFFSRRLDGSQRDQFRDLIAAGNQDGCDYDPGEVFSNSDTQNEVTVMNREQLIEILSENTDFSESELSEMGDDTLHKLNGALVENADADAAGDEGEPDSETDDGDADSEPADAGVENADGDVAEQVEAKLNDFADRIDDRFDTVESELGDVKETVSEHEKDLSQLREQRQTKRENLVQTIVDNSRFEEGDLEDQPIEFLEKQAKEVSPNYFGGSAGAGTAAPSEKANDEAPPEPKSYWNEQEEQEA